VSKLTIVGCALLGMAGFCCNMPLHAAHLNAPLWDVWVVDGDGAPVAGVQVVETYRDYSCESESHSEMLVTDAAGHVRFAAKYLHRNPVRCLHNTTSNLSMGVHASLGRDVFIMAMTHDQIGYAGDEHKDLLDWSGSPKQMTTRIVMRPDKLEQELCNRFPNAPRCKDRVPSAAAKPE